MIESERARIFICGTVRDGGPLLKRRISKLIRTFSRLFEIDFYVVESDSSDQTPRILGRLSREFACFRFISLGNLQKDLPDRVMRLTYCRNLGLDEFLSRHKERNYDYYVVLDLDGVNDGLSTSSLANSIGLFSEGFDGLFANQGAFYYDIGALRAEGWVDGNPHTDYEKLLSIGVDEKGAFKLAIDSRMIRISKEAKPILVKSAFGGLGIYKANIVLNSNYSPLSSNSEVSVEHVNFNLRLESQSRLCIVPWLINTRYTEHTIHKRLDWRVIYGISQPLHKYLKLVLGKEQIEKIVQFLRRLLSFSLLKN